jgi:hypothetical protein
MGGDVVRVSKDEGRSGYTGEVRPRLRGYVELVRPLSAVVALRDAAFSQLPERS